MTSSASEVSFTEFLQHPRRVTGLLGRARSLRLRRRGGVGDLLLMSADRAAREEEVTAASGRLLGELLHEPDTLPLVLGLMPRVFPWVHFLPGSAVEQMVAELVQVTAAGAGIENLAPVAQVLTEWRHTAEIYADPDLAQALSGPFTGEHGGLVPLPEDHAE
ncbi:MAG: hypothetical protein WCA46_22340 [Actinocatenispora sp.]